MGDGEKKKKNKKNKGKATKTGENVALSSGESTQAATEMNHESASEQNHQEPDTAIADSQNVSARELEGELERHKVHKSIIADLQLTIKDLQSSVISCIEKEASLEKKIEILQNENELFVEKESSWNLKFEQLQSEMHSCAAKEISLENKLDSMESENDSWIQKEGLIGEMVARLEEAKAGLQMQVKELERSRDNFVQENQQLMNIISLLEARIQHLESEAASFRSSMMMMTKHVSEYKDSEKQVEPVCEPSEKLVTMEAELAGTGRVNQPNGIAEHSAMYCAPSTEPDTIALPATYLLPREEIIPESSDKFRPSGTLLETINITDGNVDNIASAGVDPKELQLLDELDGSAEIVQIPLDDMQGQLVEAQEVRNDEKTEVPFSDAPLIGAPFRLISFVAKYVSGADLVNEDKHSSGR